MESRAVIIVIGNPVDGFTFMGPFETMEQAAEYGEAHIGDNWWLSFVDVPEDK